VDVKEYGKGCGEASPLQTTTEDFIDTYNAEPKPFVWSKTADEILDSVARFCKRTLETGH
jgi:hypothetical protein